jgi:hypothetical protein
MGIALRLIEEIGFEGKIQLEETKRQVLNFETSLHSR